MTGRRPTHVRHVVLGLTVAAYMITYMDRLVMSAAAPVIQEEYGFSRETMSLVVGLFRWGYALFQIPGGWLGDRIGPRRALTLVVSWWSCFTSATALAWSAASMGAIRFVFGIGEAGAFPIATRSLSRWMLKTERGFAQGITHAGSRLGGALTPPLVILLITALGWRAPFLIFGTLGLLWAAAWYIYYRDTPEEHGGVNEAERELIGKSAGSTRGAVRAVPWGKILTSGNLWLISLMYFCYAYSISVYLDWFPTYLKQHRGLDLKQMGLYAMLPLLAGTLGDLAGGSASDLWLKRGGNIRTARRAVAIFGFLAAGTAILPATFTRSPGACVAYTCVALFALELTVGVSWALPLDIGGDYAGSVSSVMNMCGNIGGAISSTLWGYMGFDLPFLICSGLCLAAAALFTRIDPGKRISEEKQTP